MGSSFDSSALHHRALGKVEIAKGLIPDEVTFLQGQPDGQLSPIRDSFPHLRNPGRENGLEEGASTRPKGALPRRAA